MDSKLNCGITGFKGVLGSEFIKKKKFNFIKFTGDISKKKQVNYWIRSNKFDLIIHFAAIVPTAQVNRNYQKALKVNFNGTKNLVDSIISNKKKIKWFFFSSTSHVYNYSKNKIKETSIEKPISKYGYTKYVAENYILKKFKKNNIKYCIGRIFSFTHKKQLNDFLIPAIKEKIKKNFKVLKFKNLNHFRDFISTNDICRAIYFLWKKKYSGIINIGSGKKVYLKNIVYYLTTKKKKDNICR